MDSNFVRYSCKYMALERHLSNYFRLLHSYEQTFYNEIILYLQDIVKNNVLFPVQAYQLAHDRPRIRARRKIHERAARDSSTKTSSSISSLSTASQALGIPNLFVAQVISACFLLGTHHR